MFKFIPKNYTVFFNSFQFSLQFLKKNNINPVTAKKFYKNQIDEQKFLKDNSNFISLSDREKIVKKIKAVTSSTKKYRKLIFILQFLHFA